MLVREVVEPFEYDDRLEMVEMPEQDRFDKSVEESGVARRFGEGEGDRDGRLADDRSRSVLMAAVCGY